MPNNNTIDKSKFKICFLINGVKGIEKILRSFEKLLSTEKIFLQNSISKTEYEEFLSKCTENKKYEPEIIKKANQIIEEFSKGENNNGKRKY